jgi:hypothetical protein
MQYLYKENLMKFFIITTNTNKQITKKMKKNNDIKIGRYYFR